MKQDNMNQQNQFDSFNQSDTQSDTIPGIHQEDSDFCNRVQEEYQKILDSLHTYRVQFTSLQEQDDPPGPLDILSKDLLYSPARTLATIEKLIEQAREALVKKVISYFADKYYLYQVYYERLVKLEILSKQEDVTAAKVVDRILKKYYHNMEQHGKTSIKIAFLRAFYSCTDATLSGCILSVPGMFNYSYLWSEERMYEDDEHKNQFDVLIRAISLFETGTCYQVIDTLAADLPESHLAGDIFHQETYEFTGCKKIKAIEFLENKLVELVFHSPDFAREFSETFECHDLYGERRPR